MGAVGDAPTGGPTGFGGGPGRFHRMVLVPEMDAEDAKQCQGSHIGEDARDRRADFVSKTCQRRMGCVRIRGICSVGPK